jgi:DNA-binding NarL/FixJ family response regulator
MMVLAAARGEPERAARLLGAAEARLDWRNAALRGEERAEYERTTSALRAKLGEALFAAAAAAGGAMPFVQAASEAARVGRAAPAAVAGPTAAPPPAAPTHGLTPRELDVLRLLAEGLSDKDIADALYISPRTVMRHVTSILAEFNVSTRTAAATHAVRHGIV